LSTEQQGQKLLFTATHKFAESNDSCYVVTFRVVLNCCDSSQITHQMSGTSCLTKSNFQKYAWIF